MSELIPDWSNEIDDDNAEPEDAGVSNPMLTEEENGSQD